MPEGQIQSEVVRIQGSKVGLDRMVSSNLASNFKKEQLPQKTTARKMEMEYLCSYLEALFSKINCSIFVSRLYFKAAFLSLFRGIVYAIHSSHR